MFKVTWGEIENYPEPSWSNIAWMSVLMVLVVFFTWFIYEPEWSRDYRWLIWHKIKNVRKSKNSGKGSVSPHGIPDRFKKLKAARTKESVKRGTEVEDNLSAFQRELAAPNYKFREEQVNYPDINKEESKKSV